MGVAQYADHDVDDFSGCVHASVSLPVYGSLISARVGMMVGWRDRALLCVAVCVQLFLSDPLPCKVLGDARTA